MIDPLVPPQTVATRRRALDVAGAAILLALSAFALTACRPKPFPTYPANYREYAYVANSGSNTVSVFDVVNVRLDREITVGNQPVAVAASSTRKEVYVVNSGGGLSLGSLTVIDTEKNAVAATIPLHRGPIALALSADGKSAWIANRDSNSVSLVDLEQRREVANVPAGATPADVLLSPDGKTLALANSTPGTVTLIDPASRQIRSTLSGCAGASNLVILPDSTKVFAACSAGHQVMSITLAGPAHPGRPDQIEAMLDVGRTPVQLALKPDGGELFAMNSLSDSISEVVTSTNDVGGAYMIGDKPVRGLISSDNSTLYVANRNSQYVTLYSVDDGKLLTPGIKVGDGPSALAFASNGYLLLVVDSGSNDVAVVRLQTRSLFTVLPTGKNPTAIAVKSFTE